MSDPTPSPAEYVKCWKCETDRNSFGDGSRFCTNCGASDEPGWERINW